MSSPNQRPTGRASVSGRSSSSRGPARGAARGSGSRAARQGTTNGDEPVVRRGPKPRWDRIALVAVLALALCAGFGGAGLWVYGKWLEGAFGRSDPFSSLTQGRPPVTVNGAQNILLVGTDMAHPESPADIPGQARTDTMILMHIPASQDHAYLISLPRDLWVSVPQKATDPDCGSRRAKLNAAYAWGDLPLLVRTVECFTSVRIDHVIQINFGGFEQVVDALGGVDMPIERDIVSIHPPHRQFKQGVMHLNGAEALDYTRQRKQFPDGDFARMRHQQQLLKIMLDKAASSETLTNPKKFNRFVQAVSKAVTVDKDFKLLDMAIQFRGLRSQDLTFLTSPYASTDEIGGQSVVLSDRTKAIALYNAINADRMREWIQANMPPSPTVGATR